MISFVYYGVYAVRSAGGDGCGPTVCLGRFSKYNDAVQFAYKKGEWGTTDGDVIKKTVTIFENLDECRAK